MRCSGQPTARNSRPHDGHRDPGWPWVPLDDVFTAQAQLALLAVRQGAWGEARNAPGRPQALVEEIGPRRLPGERDTRTLRPHASHLHETRHEDARAALATRPPSATSARPRHALADHPMGSSSRACISRSPKRAPPARSSRETERVLELRPDMGFLVDEAGELRERVAATSEPAGAWAMSLTGAELRLLPDLATHLTFPEIASRLFISRNTVKTPSGLDLPQARRLVAQRGNRPRRRGGLPRRLDFLAGGESHTGALRRSAATRSSKPRSHDVSPNSCHRYDVGRRSNLP